MACYFNYFIFTLCCKLNVGDFLSKKKAYISPLNVMIWRLVKFKTTLSPSQVPKKLNNIDFID